MSPNQMDTAGAIPLANGIGFVFGMMGVIALFIQQSLVVFLPLMLPAILCTIFCVLVYKTQPSDRDDASASPNPVRFDLI